MFHFVLTFLLIFYLFVLIFAFVLVFEREKNERGRGGQKEHKIEWLRMGELGEK